MFTFLFPRHDVTKIVVTLLWMAILWIQDYSNLSFPGECLNPVEAWQAPNDCILKQYASWWVMQFECSCSEIWSLSNGTLWSDGVLILYSLLIISSTAIFGISQHLAHGPAWKDLVVCLEENLASGWSLITSLSLVTQSQTSPLELWTLRSCCRSKLLYNVAVFEEAELIQLPYHKSPYQLIFPFLI